MRDFTAAKELFRDVIDSRLYFDSVSAEIARYKIENSIEGRDAPLIFLIGDPGVGKSYILKLISSELEKKSLSIFIDHPFFDKRDLLKILYEAKGMEFDKDINFNELKANLLKEYKNSQHTIFIDEAQLLNEEQFELIRILSDTKVFQFVLSMHKEEGSAILEKKHFKSRTKAVVEYGKLHHDEVLRYIQSTLFLINQGEIANMFSKKHSLKITRYCNGNFRTVKKFLYTLITLLEYAKQNGLRKYDRINNFLLKMSALEIGVIHD
ncbi:MAG: ATP-binding protein [Sulfurospirillaceae bacterium]|nr:ATP-binding protein [Sulfurospirillaceae bacterium]